MAMAQHRSVRPARTPMDLARALGWFSIGLGVAEVVAPGLLSRMLGVRGRETLVRGFGWREIATGVGVLASRDPTPWIKGRLAGDALDLAALSAANVRRNPRRRTVRQAIWMVLGVTALDAICAEELQRTRSRRWHRRHPEHDYSDRVGMPKSPDQMRGAAARDIPASAQAFGSTRMPGGGTGHPDMLHGAGP
jgi:hypothetical protein